MEGRSLTAQAKLSTFHQVFSTNRMICTSSLAQFLRRSQGSQKSFQLRCTLCILHKELIDEQIQFRPKRQTPLHSELILSANPPSLHRCVGSLCFCPASLKTVLYKVGSKKKRKIVLSFRCAESKRMLRRTWTGIPCFTWHWIFPTSTGCLWFYRCLARRKSEDQIISIYTNVCIYYIGICTVCYVYIYIHILLQELQYTLSKATSCLLFHKQVAIIMVLSKQAVSFRYPIDVPLLLSQTQLCFRSSNKWRSSGLWGRSVSRV